MTGRCQRRRRAMAGDRNTAEAKKIDSPNLDEEFTEKPSCLTEITKVPSSSTVEFDSYTQARKVLSFRSPFDSEETPAPAVSVSNANTLPSRISHLLIKHSEGRKRHKKAHSSSDKKSSAVGKSGGRNIWVETEDYFRQLTVEDIERLERVSSVVFSGNEKCFLIPSFGNDDDYHIRYNGFNRKRASACEDNLSLENRTEVNSVGEGDVKESVVIQEENGPSSMDVDGDEGAIHDFEIKEESNGGKRENGGKEDTYFSGVEWLLGSRSKIYLTTERPSKKRKLLGKEAGLEKLLVARPVEGLDSVCHYCSYGDIGDPLNRLIKCGSCGMVIHQRCYGVPEDVDSSWSCSWCKLNKSAGLSTERPCLLCPRPGGALKPVDKVVCNEEMGSEMGFAHLFCCQWIPEVYLENTRAMEPIMNLDQMNDTRKKLICNLCRVKWGACVRCSNGACRTSFHPICAREARHRMEIWGKLGCDEVELRAFCNKHSDVQYDRRSRKAGSLKDDSVSCVSNNKQMGTIVSESLKLKIGQRNGDKLDICVEPANKDPSELNDKDSDLPDGRPSSESQSENCDILRPADKEDVDMNGTGNINAFSSPDFTVMLKKLIDLGKVDVEDVASEIGVSPDSLSTILTDNHMVPELQYKLIRWLKNHAHIGSLQKNLKVKIRSLADPKADTDVAEGAQVTSAEESGISDAVPIKSVPPRRRTKSNIRIVKDDKSCNFKEKTIDDTTEGEDICVRSTDSTGIFTESLPEVVKKMLVDPELQKDDPMNHSFGNKDEPVRSVSQEGKQSEQIATCSPAFANGEVMPTSYVHPFIYSKLMQTKNCVLGHTLSYPSAGVQEDLLVEASTSSGLCCNNHNGQANSGDWSHTCRGGNLEQLAKTSNTDMLKLSPADEVEGELIYHQHRILCNAISRKRISDDLISKVTRSLPWEIDVAGREKWDAVLVSQYNHELREAKKKGRKERRHKEAQAVLAAATAAAAASSRLATRKDAAEEPANQEDLLKMDVSNVKPGYSQLNPRVRNTISRSTVPRPSSDGNSEYVQMPSHGLRDRPRICEICTRAETILNPVLVCLSCKVAVHLDCYRSVKSTTGPWHCELCEDLFSSQGSGAPASNSLEKPYLVAECCLCGGTASAFRKSVDGQWIHALCAEWVLESTYRRGQVNLIEGMENVSKGMDTCSVCRRKQGVCLKCSYGHCQSTFHPTCARSAGFYMTARTSGGKLQHKAYCEKHSLEQRAKTETQKHGVEEFKSLKQVRVELERLRLLCERIIKREKLKRELVLCSHDILASNRDSVLSALARHPFYQPEVSSESATTSIRGYTDGYKSGSETVQRSDDITVDSTVAGKRRFKFPVSMDSDQKTVDSSTSQNLYTLKPIERVSFSGKQIQRPGVTSWNLLEDAETRSRHKKHTETFEKELLMTSDQASMKNQRLPKGFVYVPIRSIPKDKDTVPDASVT